MRPLVFLLALAAHASVIDTSTLFTSGTVQYRFNLDGQAYTPEGVPVTGVTFGFDPLPPCSCVIPPPMGALPPLGPNPPRWGAPTPEPTSETSEPGTWIAGAVMILMGRRKR